MMLGLGMAGLFQLLSIQITLAVLGLLSLLIPANGEATLRNDLLAATRYIQRSASDRWVSIGIATALAGLAYHLALLVTDGPLFHSDDFAYHGPTLSAWLQNGSLENRRICFAEYYPFNPHLLSLFLILHTGDFQWVWLANPYWQLMAVVALLVFGISHGRRGFSVAALCAGVLLMGHEFTWQARFVGVTDMVGVVAFTVGLVLARPRRSGTRGHALALAALVGAMLSYAAGTKIHYAAMAVLVSPFVLAALARPTSMVRSWNNWASITAWYLGGAFITSSFWYLRNLWMTGNPVFPVALGPFGGPGDYKTFRNTTLNYFIKTQGHEWKFWYDLAHQALDWPLIFGVMLVPALGLGFVLAARTIWRAIRLRSLIPLGSQVVAGSVAALLLLLIIRNMPYSGTWLGGGDVLRFPRRYIIFCVVAGFFILTTLAGSGRLLTTIRVGAVLSVVACLPSKPLDGYLVWYLLVLLTFCVATVVLARATSVILLNRFTLAGIPVLFFGVLMIRDSAVPPPYLRIYREPLPQKFSQVFAPIDELPPGSRITQFTHNSWEVWHLYGSRAQHHPVILDQYARIMPPLHDAWNRGLIQTANHPRLGVPIQGILPDPETFPERLVASEVDYVLVSIYISDVAWPVQRVVIQAMPEFELIYADGYSELYRRKRS
jgi:hypothetical protein